MRLAPAKHLAARIAALAAGQPVHKQFIAETRGIDDEKRTCTFKITTGSVDRDNDTISPKGWDTGDFMKNPVVLWAHDYSMLPVAMAIDLVPTETGLESTAQFPPKGLHPFADTVFEMVKLGMLNATSVGFRPLEFTRDEERGGLNFVRQSLLEWSIVPVPANAEALIVARTAGIDVEPLQEWARKVLKLTNPQGETVPEDLSVTPNCPACGLSLDSQTICEGCGWRGPLAEPLNHPHNVPSASATIPIEKHIPSAVMAKRVASPRVIRGGYAVVDAGDDPIRWNRNLSKAFDVAGEPAEPSRLEYAWAARYLDTPVQNISVSCTEVASARLGSYLSAYQECLGAWTIEATRRLTEGGREVPPESETIQLNSLNERSFLVSGTRFMCRQDGVKIVSKVERHWFGLAITNYCRQEQSAVLAEWVARVNQRSSEINYLKGEAFTLSGEFLDRGNLDWPALFLEPEKEKVLRRTVERINQDGENMESRGLMMMGPPGTGKTLTGRVMMRQADTTFIWVSARDFYRMGSFGSFTYAFDIAAQCAPSIIFFEDVDNWISSTEVDLLKTEMDGLKRRKGIQTVLTTNFPELIPDALIDRPGRFHDLLELDLPTEAVRTRMLASWAPAANETERAAIAQATEGMSGAHLRELVNFASTVTREENLEISAALARALEKINEQRELVASLREAPDYRPGRAVRRAIGTTMAYVAKRGRVLSAANESLIRAASDNMSRASSELGTVLQQLESQPQTEIQPDASDSKAIAIELADEDVMFEVEDDGEAEFNPTELRDVLAEVIRAEVAPIVRQQTQHALLLARGRVD